MKFQLIIDPSKEESVVATVHSPNKLTQELENLVRGYEGADKILAYNEDETILLPYVQIACISVLEGKTYAIGQDGIRYRLKQRLYELEVLLPAYFIRISKSAIANEHQIERFHAGYSGAVDVIFTCGYREYVSRRCFGQVKRRFGL